MMIVDLVDEVDFKEKLVSIGAPIELTHDLKDVDKTLAAWLNDYPEQAYFVKCVCQEIHESGATILPEVKTVMQPYLSH